MTDRPLRYAIYARYSSDRQDETSCEDQITMCIRYVDQHNGIVVDTYKDSAVTGTTANRDHYNRMLADVQDGKIDVVLALTLDRLSRDQEDQARLYKLCKYHESKIVTLNEGEVNQMVIGFKGTMAAIFSVDLSKRVKDGMDEGAKRGKALGRIPYGYKIEYERDANGERVLHNNGRRKSGKLVIDEEKADVVRMIYVWYAEEDISPIEIARRLNEKGIKSSYDKEWTAAGIRGKRENSTGILGNWIYVGKRVRNRTKTYMNPHTQKRINKPLDQSEWDIIEDEDLRIVGDNLWKAVGAKLEEKSIGRCPKNNPLTAARRPRYLLSGKMECGCCGSNFRMVATPFLGCGGYVSGKKCETKQRVEYSRAEEAILNGLKTHLLTPENIDRFLDMYEEEYQEKFDEYNDQQKRLKRQAQSVQGKIDRIMRTIEDGTISQVAVGTIGKRLAELEKEKLEVDAKLSRLIPVKVPKRNKVQVYRDQVVDLTDSLNDPEIKKAAFAALRPLIDKVVFHYNDGQWTLEFTGDLGGMIGSEAALSEPVFLAVE